VTSLPANLVDILRCPMTQTRLVRLGPQQVEKLERRRAKHSLYHLDGTTVSHPLDQAFVSEDGKFIYPVEDGIIILLPHLAIATDAELAARYGERLGVEKKSVMEFYDRIGWQEQGQTFTDAARFEDLRPVSRDYIHKCHLRVGRYLKPRGVYLLDAASGPLQYPEYLTYSQGYDYRICADISFVALREAKKKIGKKGIYILCDVTNLPLQDETVDGFVSLHTIYHIPADEQATAVRELHRVLKTGRTGVVVYSWGGHSPLTKLLMLPYSFFKRSLGKDKASEEKELFYFHHKYAWYRHEIRRQCNSRLAVWRSLSVAFLKRLVHPHTLGKSFLLFVYTLEDAFPSFLGRIGHYPMFIIYRISAASKSKDRT